MTLEEKAKAYDIALEKARKYHAAAKSINDPSAARYENIFPELHESEDERTRKELVEKITNLACGCFISQEQKQKFIAYLEKQEQKSNIELIQRSWYLEGYQDRKFGKESMWIITTGEDGPKYELNPKYGKKLVEEQKPTEWSEDDEKLLDFWLDVIDRNDWRMDEDFCKASREFINRLKSFRPKSHSNKLSKKDKKILLSLHHVMNCTDAQNVVKRDGLSVEDVCNFLFSIEPQWKPSEEQIDALDTVLEHEAERVGSSKELEKAIALSEQLKKLM